MTFDTAGLTERLAARAAELDAKVGYAITPLDDGESIRANADAVMPTASSIKVYLLAALYAADAAGRLSLDERVEYLEEHKVLGSGVFKLLAPGLAPTLRDHARLMIVISDNVSTNVVLRALGGPEEAHAAVQALPVDLPGTEVRDFINFNTWEPDAFAVSTPDEFCAVLAAIFHQRCTGSAEHDAEVYWTLRRQQLRNMIPRHLPCNEHAEDFGFEETVRCGTKSGGLPSVTVDVGIVETPARAWAMAVQVHGGADYASSDDHPRVHLVADLSKMVFDAWGGQ